MAIYIITHKIYERLRIHEKQDEYKPLLVGAYAADDQTRGRFLYKDDAGDNISIKNPHYCELTGLYWIWKNTSDVVVGIDHYRRIFSRSYGRNGIVKYKDVLLKLNKYDIILPIPSHLKQSLKEQYCIRSGKMKDLDIVEDVVKGLHPDYSETYDIVMNGNVLHSGNMLITSRTIYDNYCSWLFSILFEAEKYIDIEGYDDYERRIYGFISERLLNVYVKHNNLRICQMGVVNTEEHIPFYPRIPIGIKRMLIYYLQ